MLDSVAANVNVEVQQQAGGECLKLGARFSAIESDGFCRVVLGTSREILLLHASSPGSGLAPGLHNKHQGQRFAGRQSSALLPLRGTQGRERRYPAS